MSEKTFKVGDVIITDYQIFAVGNYDHKGVVTMVDEDSGNLYVLWSDGSCGWHRDGKFYKKTGEFLDIERHILSRLRSYE